MSGSSVNPVPPLITSTPMILPKGSHLSLSSAPLEGSIITLSLEQSYPKPPSLILISSSSRTTGYCPVPVVGELRVGGLSGNPGAVTLKHSSLNISSGAFPG